MLLLTYASEIVGELTFVALIGQLWAFPFLVYFNVVNTQKISRWTLWAVTTLLLGYPNGESAPFTGQAPSR